MLAARLRALRSSHALPSAAAGRLLIKPAAFGWLPKANSRPIRGFGSASAHAEGQLAIADQDFGRFSFNDAAMAKAFEHKPHVLERFKKCIRSATAPLDHDIAEEVAQAMLKWARKHGATHYTHWFQPLGGRLSEKHDTFLDIKGCEPITRFTAKQLLMAETDGSSFPSGGVRSTSNARGYTAWDPSSHPFIVNHGNGATLYIPSCFFAWKDCLAVDDKTPMLRSDVAVKRELLRMLAAAGETHHTEAYSESGLEQEFFIVDEDSYLKRPDLVACGRTLIGRLGAKGQQLEDQYWGTMTARALNAIHDMEKECWSLGIPIQTRHREVAPGQYEMAPRFADMSVAIDRNLLMLETMRRIAKMHGLVCLVHEKPFKGVNGSGKHNNWSLATDKVHLMRPGKDPHLNLHFMMILAAILRAVDLHGDVLRVAVCGASNDHRLGANEAPPSVMSVYLGSAATEAMRRFIAGDKNPGPAVGVDVVDTAVNLGVPFLPRMTRDEGDRNRTSPFAFTGNRFEFRAVGSSQNPARSSVAINACVADSLAYMADEFIKAGGGREAAEKVTRALLEKHQRAHFEGDGYSEEWRVEAKRRGLLELKTTGQALAEMLSPKNVELFQRTGVLSEQELRIRWAVLSEDYHKRIEMEARTLVDMIEASIVPVVSSHAAALATNAQSALQKQHATRLSDLLDTLLRSALQITHLTNSMHDQKTFEAVNSLIELQILPAMDFAREAADEVEGLIPFTAWPFPSYTEMLHRNPHV